MLRGEIWWADLDPTRGGEIRKRRPVVILTADPLNRARRTVIVAPLTTGSAPRPPLVVPTPSAGPESKAVCDQIRALDKSRLSQRIGRLSVADLAGVEGALKIVLAL